MKWFKTLSAVCTMLLATSVALAQSSGNYSLTWFSVDGGAGNSSNGSYTVADSIGQQDAAIANGGS